MKNETDIIKTQFFHSAEALGLESGLTLSEFTIAYETYGKLNKAKNNAILIVHALSGSAHASGYNEKNDKKPGWWDLYIGPGKPFDTNKFFIICSNIIGSCHGSTGPASINPSTGKSYGLSFPIITIKDMVDAQARLLDHLGIDRLLCVSGGSMGGMQALQWTISYPGRVCSVIPIATTAKLSAQSIAFNEVGRQAIMSDPAWNFGNYYDRQQPLKGLAVARMIGHITYLSPESMRLKFGRQLKNEGQKYAYNFLTEFQVESYLHHQGDSFVKNFDANSYLYITKAMDYFDMSHKSGSLEKAFKNVNSKFLILSISSDWLFPSYQAQEIVDALKNINKNVSYIEMESRHGHDSFLIKDDEKKYSKFLAPFLNNVYNEINQ